MSDAFDPDKTPDSEHVNYGVLDPANTDVFAVDANPPALTVKTPHDAGSDQ